MPLRQRIKGFGFYVLAKTRFVWYILADAKLILRAPLLFDISRSERIVEYAWVLKNLDLEKGRVLDIGCGATLFPIMMASLGYEVIGVDLNDYGWTHPNFTFVKCDILDPPPTLLNQKFDVIISVSSVEHVGLGVTNIDEDGDLKAVQLLRGLLSDGGVLFMTAGYGGKFQFHKTKSRPHTPTGRLYDEERLERLSSGLKTERKSYFLKNKRGEWRPCTPQDVKHITYPETWDETMSIFCMKLRK